VTQIFARWTARQSPLTRAVLWFLAITGAVFLIGFFIGFGVAMIEKGRLPRELLSYAALAGAAAAMTGCVALINALRHGQPPETPYERRYNRAILAFGGIGGLVGLTLALAKLGGPDEPEHLSLEWLLDPAAFQSMSPAAAIGAAVLLLVVLGVAFSWYHRIIDDHEERSVLWGSTIGYYFLLFAVPCWLLLAAGGLLPAMTGAIAFALVLASTVIQAGVWAWLKYR
jgi:hypothetical protein